MIVSKSDLVVGLALSALAAFSTPTTRTDIEGMTIPGSWDASGRSTYQYQVDVVDSAFATLDTFDICVVEKTFDLDSYKPGFLLFLR